jgi:hypothetical protein
MGPDLFNMLTTRRLRKLRTMPASEIAYRSWQEASKWVGRISPATVAIDPATWLLSRAPAMADPDAALSIVREQLPQRFFEGAADANAGVRLTSRFSDAAREIRAAADAFLDGRFDLLGYTGLSFGDPIDWHLDPVSSIRAPREHWSRIDPLDPQTVGDSKVVWELNRHQWLVRLAQAWTVSGQPHYAAACVNAIDSWRRDNPVDTGINWASSLELAYRLIAWSWVLVLIRNAPALTAEWIRSLLPLVWHHADHIRRYLSYYSSPNTHLTGEALGLFYAGVLFREFQDAAEWRTLGLRILLKESDRQILDDGVHFEQSTCYQVYTIEIYLHFLLLAARNGVPLPEPLPGRVSRMVEFLLNVRQPDGSIPNIGDCDGGVLLPLVRRQRQDGRGVFAAAAARFHREDFAWAAEGPAPEVFWLMGAAGQRAFDAMRSEAPHTGSRLFASGGYAVMRTGWDRTAHHLIADAGPLGCSTSSGHGHADLLSVQLAIFGEPCLVDAGTSCYTTEPEWRDTLRSTAAHNTVMVDGVSQAESAGPFRWHQRPTASIRSWESTRERDVLDAEHMAYRRLADPVSCRRRVVFVKPDYWSIADDLDGAAPHTVELTFQFAPTMRVTVADAVWVRAETPRGRVLWMRTFSSPATQLSIKCGEQNPLRGWVSSDYGRCEPAPAVVFSTRAQLPWRVVTLLIPDQAGSATPPNL